MKKLRTLLVGAAVALLLVPTLVMAQLSHGDGYVDLTGAELKIEREWDANGLVSQHNLVDDSWTTYENGVAAQTTMAGEVIADYTYKDGVLHSITDQYSNVTSYEKGKRTKTIGHRPGGEEYVMSTFSYDASGRLTAINGETAEGQATKVTYSYDGAILLSSLSQGKADGEWNQGSRTTYESGRAVGSNNLDTGGHSTIHYDGVKKTHAENYDDGGGLTSTTYFDNHGRADYTNDMEGNLQMDYVYDGAHLVQTVYYPGGEGGEYKEVTEYDQYGNIGDTYWV